MPLMAKVTVASLAGDWAERAESNRIPIAIATINKTTLLRSMQFASTGKL